LPIFSCFDDCGSDNEGYVLKITYANERELVRVRRSSGDLLPDFVLQSICALLAFPLAFRFDPVKRDALLSVRVF
jgi:hypothetical protein